MILENLRVRNAYFSSFGPPKGYFKLVGGQNAYFSRFGPPKGYFKFVKMGMHISRVFSRGLEGAAIDSGLPILTPERHPEPRILFKSDKY